jgi:hypothetical protein
LVSFGVRRLDAALKMRGGYLFSFYEIARLTQKRRQTAALQIFMLDHALVHA